MVKFWFVPAWIMLGLLRVLIKVSSFRRLVRFFGTETGPLALPSQLILAPAQHRTAANISAIVRLAAKYSPWRANCFPQALCASLLLNLYRLPFATYLGLAREPASAKVTAHAWVRAGSLVVTGDGDLSKYALVGCFTSSRMGTR
jgi:hypothetical protein